MILSVNGDSISFIYSYFAGILKFQVVKIISQNIYKIELNNFVAHQYSYEIKGGSLSFIYSYQNAVIWHPWVPPVNHN